MSYDAFQSRTADLNPRNVTLYLRSGNMGSNFFQLVWFHKSGLAREPRKISQRCKWQADKDRDARRGEKHPFFQKSPQTDEGSIRDICGL